jgi:tetratricopeptide (TPR) repeat protein
MRAALELAGPDAPPRLRARALALRAALWGRVPGGIQGRADDLRASLAISRELGDPRDVIFVLMRLSHAEFDLERRDGAVAAADEALALAQELGDRTLISRALAVRAAAEPEHPDAPERAREASRALARDEELTDALSLLINVGYVALADRRLTDARILFEDALALAGSHRLAFYVVANLGLAHLLLGQDEAAMDALRRALEAARDSEIEEFDEPLLALAALAAKNQQLERAARLAGAGHAHTPAVLRHYELRVDAILQSEYLTPARDQLGAQRWDEIAARGARLGREDAIELGLEAATEPHEPPVPAPVAPE